jgi:hypothetical protein
VCISPSLLPGKCTPLRLVHGGDSPLQLTATELMDFSVVAPVEECARVTFEELCKLRDRLLFNKVMLNPMHVLHRLLQPKSVAP